MARLIGEQSENAFEKIKKKTLAHLVEKPTTKPIAIPSPSPRLNPHLPQA